MQKQNFFIRLFFGTKLRVLLITLPIIIAIIGLSIFAYQYETARGRWEKNKVANIRKVNEFYHLIDKTVNKELYKKPHLKTSQPDLEIEGTSIISYIYDRYGRIIGKFAHENRSLVGISDISAHFIDALLATEDRDFYSHNGVNYKAIARAMVRNILAFRFHQGGSTITQQLAKVMVTNRERNIQRKLYEIFVAREIERRFDKNSILLMYINKVHFGHNVDGVEEAAQLYFGKKARDLDLPESALLAGIISNPVHFSPYNNRENAKSRHYRILKGMADTGKIPGGPDEFKKIHKKFWDKYVFDKKKGSFRKYRVLKNESPYVYEEVRRQLMKKLNQRFNNDIQKARDSLYKGGWKIYTSIDLKLQKKAEEVLRKGIYNYRLKAKKHKRMKKYWYGIEGALVAIDPATGYISAFVGGYKFDKNNQFNRAFQAYRQPGSCFKPVCYLAALNRRFVSPYTLMYDKYEPIELRGGKTWKVHNYGNYYANGPITLTQALKKSSNQIAARLVSNMGIPPIRELVKLSLDIRNAEDRFPNEMYSIALGTVEMTPLELAQVYAMMANHGMQVRPKLITKIENVSGEEIILDDQISSESLRNSIQVVSDESAYLITQMLRQVLTPGGTGQNIKKEVELEFDVVGKTGTSQNYKDLWFAGYTPQLCTVVWIGHDKFKSLDGGGGKIAGPIFGRFMKEASKIIPFDNFKLSSRHNLRYENICRDSGKVAIEGVCPNIHYHSAFIDGTEPSEYCSINHNQIANGNTTIQNESNESHSKQIITNSRERNNEEEAEQLNDLSNRKIPVEPRPERNRILEPRTERNNRESQQEEPEVLNENDRENLFGDSLSDSTNEFLNEGSRP